MRRVLVAACGVVLTAGLGAAVVAAVVTVMLVSSNAPAAQASLSRCQLTSTGVTVGQLDSEQVDNARLVIAVGKARDVPARGWVVAIAAAMQESTLRNLDYGDRDSLGLMQQRPSAGWGTPTQVRDPEYAIRAFFGGPDSPTSNTGLLDVPGWQEMPIWRAAQAVQRSAFPYAYQAHERLASTLVKQFAGTSAGCEQVAAGPWTLPLPGGYRLTSEFGPRTSPTRGGSELHTGLDFAAASGTPALAVSTGRVTFTGPGGGYGNLVKIRHANGVETWYAHLSGISAAVGEQVAAGEPVGFVGSTGNSTGPHLHLEVRVDGLPTDPYAWLRQRGVDP